MDPQLIEIQKLTHIRCGSLKDNPHIGVVELARPSKSNAFNKQMFQELAKAFSSLEAASDIRVILLCGSGRNFCAGIDVAALSTLVNDFNSSSCQGRASERLRREILHMQETLSCLERCRCPVIAAVHGACIGGGVDLICAADIRMASPDATFCVKEVQLAITADLGTLQRLPKIVGHGLTADLALTGRVITANEAAAARLVTRVTEQPGRDAVLAAALALAAEVASLPPLAVTGTKRVLLHSRDHSVADGLEYVATWNAGQLISSDLTEVLTSRAEHRKPIFSKL